MNKTITFLIISLMCSVFGVKAQSDTVNNISKNVIVPTMVSLDSLTMAHINAIFERIEMATPRYKIYQTENTYNLLKLDTATGRIWQVQYRLGDTESMTVAIDETSLLWSDEPIRPGRFELYSTKNMYQFILLDTETGRTWQVQWNTKYEKRFRERIL